MNEELFYLIKNYKQVIVTDINESGQLRIKNAKVLLIGVGGLGNVCALYLSSIGIGILGIVDDDNIDLTNLHRQIAYKENEINKKKIYRIKKKINENNRYCKVFCYDVKINSYNFLNKFKNYDIIVDGTDNLISREIINYVSLMFKIPFIYGSINNFEGRISVFNFNNSSCYNCLNYLNSNINLNNCSDSGILGLVPGIIGLLQAYEAVKIIINLDNILFNKILIFNLINYSIKILLFKKKNNCSCNNFLFSSLNKNQLVCADNKIKDFSFFISISMLIKISKSGLFYLLINLYESSNTRISNSLSMSSDFFYNNNAIVKKFFFFSKKVILIFYCNTGTNSYFLCSFLKKKNIKSYCLLGGFINYKNTINYLKLI